MGLVIIATTMTAVTLIALGRGPARDRRAAHGGWRRVPRGLSPLGRPDPALRRRAEQDTRRVAGLDPLRRRHHRRRLVAHRAPRPAPREAVVTGRPLARAALTALLARRQRRPRRRAPRRRLRPPRQRGLRQLQAAQVLDPGGEVRRGRAPVRDGRRARGDARAVAPPARGPRGGDARRPQGRRRARRRALADGLLRRARAGPRRSRPSSGSPIRREPAEARAAAGQKFLEAIWRYYNLVDFAVTQYDSKAGVTIRLAFDEAEGYARDGAGPAATPPISASAAGARRAAAAPDPAKMREPLRRIAQTLSALIETSSPSTRRGS